MEMAEAQQAALSDSHGSVGEMLQFLGHSKKEMAKLNEEPKKIGRPGPGKGGSQ